MSWFDVDEEQLIAINREERVEVCHCAAVTRNKMKTLYKRCVEMF